MNLRFSGHETFPCRYSWLPKAYLAIEADPRLINRYDVIELSPQKHREAKLTAAKVFVDWLVSTEGQQAIGAYQVDGQKLFNPSAGSPK